MKNYKFVVGLLLSSVFLHVAQAASPSPAHDANRAAFPATGGSSIVFQNGNAVSHPAGSPFAMTRPAPTVEQPINNVMSFANLPKAFHYLEGGADSEQGLRAQTKMAQHSAAAEDIAEPATEMLLLTALSALAIAIRRQSPS